MALKSKRFGIKEDILSEIHNYGLLIETREIFLHSSIESEEDFGIDHRVLNSFIKNIKLLEHLSSTLPIIIHLHSIGGDVMAGMGIYDAIKTCSAPVIIITHGLAVSMGSLIPQAGDLIITMPNCCWMIHLGTTGISPELTVKNSYSWMEWEKKETSKMMDIYCKSMSKAKMFKGKTLKQISNYIIRHLDKNEDWIFEAQEAIDHGFCDAIYGSEGYETLEDLKIKVEY